MLIKRNTPDLLPSEITPRQVYEGRRQLIVGAGAGVALSAAPVSVPIACAQKISDQRLKTVPSPHSTNEPPTPHQYVTTYNNYYEFGTDKDEPAVLAQGLRLRPWTVSVEREVLKPRVFDVDELLAMASLEERIYRLRCVEGWSMVIPWVGYSLSELIRRVQPTGDAKYVEFTTLADKNQMPGLSSNVLEWPYVEGLRIDEANHPLTLLTFGLYGEVLPRQNGAPVRMVIPWKYGFKSGKSIVRIRFTRTQPVTSWSRAIPREYGFYSNVNPAVNHPRWSQATERRIGEGGIFQRKRPTLMFNGYADQVASLYAGMDLRKFF